MNSVLPSMPLAGSSHLTLIVLFGMPMRLADLDEGAVCSIATEPVHRSELMHRDAPCCFVMLRRLKPLDGHLDAPAAEALPREGTKQGTGASWFASACDGRPSIAAWPHKVTKAGRDSACALLECLARPRQLGSVGRRARSRKGAKAKHKQCPG